MRKQRSDKGGHHNYPKRNKNVAADIKISNKQQLLTMAQSLLSKKQEHYNQEIALLKQRANFFKRNPQVVEGIQNDITGETIQRDLELNKLQKFIEDVQNRKRVTNKTLELYSSLFNVEDKAGRVILNRLMDADKDISSVTEIKNYLGGYSPEQIYKAYIAMGHKADDFYEDFTGDEQDTTIEEIVSFLNGTGEEARGYYGI